MCVMCFASMCLLARDVNGIIRIRNFKDIIKFIEYSATPLIQNECATTPHIRRPQIRRPQIRKLVTSVEKTFKNLVEVVGKKFENLVTSVGTNFKNHVTRVGEVHML